MQKKSVTRAELEAWLTHELNLVAGGGGSVFRVLARLPEPGADGCNWSGAEVQLGPEADGGTLLPMAQQILARAKDLFDLNDD